MTNPGLKEEFDKVYRAFADTKDQIADMNKGVKDLIKALAKKTGIKTGLLNRAFNYMYKKNETGEDIIADIQQVLSEIEQ